MSLSNGRVLGERDDRILRITTLALAPRGIAVVFVVGVLLGALLTWVVRRAPDMEESAGGERRSCVLFSGGACADCAKLRCLAQCAGCEANPDCLALMLCVVDCPTEACELQCMAKLPAGQGPFDVLMGINGCLAESCRDACTLSPSRRR